MPLKWDAKLEALLDEYFANHKGAEKGKMFGVPGYMVNGKLAVGLFEDSVLLKLGKERVDALLKESDFSAHTPNGRNWKDWVLVTANQKNHTNLFEEAVKYVTKETSK
ncbi:hypothetical protein MASR2M15_15270 [Anaerolineales bacterium]